LISAVATVAAAESFDDDGDVDVNVGCDVVDVDVNVGCDVVDVDADVSAVYDGAGLLLVDFDFDLLEWISKEDLRHPGNFAVDDASALVGKEAGCVHGICRWNTCLPVSFLKELSHHHQI
jgi:hypothetical protein